MPYDREKIDDTALAILLLTLHDENVVWKNLAWEVMDSLYDKGYISNPKNKNKSLVLSTEGLKKAQEIFDSLFKSED